MKKSPIEIFSEWVDNGKDDGMEVNHSSAVSIMLNKVLNISNDYSFHRCWMWKWMGRQKSF